MIAILKRKFISGHDYQIGYLDSIRGQAVFLPVLRIPTIRNRVAAEREAKHQAKMAGLDFSPALLIQDLTRPCPVTVKAA
jgi:hypothetical protein